MQTEAALITGVSSGIGLALAKHYLEAGWPVYGVARQMPPLLSSYSRFRFVQCDLSDLKAVDTLHRSPAFARPEHRLSTVYLNAGVSGDLPQHAKSVNVEEVSSVFTVNVLSNKHILDLVLAAAFPPRRIVASASIAGVRYRAGMLPYSVSKAALLALIGTYAEEHPETFFLSLGMCNVDTKLSRAIIANKRVVEFPAHRALRERFDLPGYAVSPEQRAKDVYEIVNSPHIDRLKSGSFHEIRELLPALSPIPTP